MKLHFKTSKIAAGVGARDIFALEACIDFRVTSLKCFTGLSLGTSRASCGFSFFSHAGRGMQIHSAKHIKSEEPAYLCPNAQKRGVPNSPKFSITFLKCFASCWHIFIFGLHFPGTLIFVPCAKSFVFYTFRSRGAWGRPNVPKMPLVTFRFRRLEPIARAFGPNGWTFRRSEPPLQAV